MVEKEFGGSRTMKDKDIFKFSVLHVQIKDEKGKIIEISIER